ncbi:MAG: hypothetical protein AAF518_26685, partial [Spirochaetota bacterium]
MNTLELKSDIIKLIDIIEDEAILQAIRVLLLKQVPEREQEDFWDVLPTSVQQEIEVGLAEADAGNVFSHEDIMQEMREKYLQTL